MTSDSNPEAVEDPISYFLEDLRLHGKSDRTRQAYERVLLQFDAFLHDRDMNLHDATQRHCMMWVHDLREGHAASTIASYASYVNRFYGYMNQVGTFDSNPMTLVMEEMDESIETDPTRRDISIPDMRRFVAGITHPLERAIVVTLLKTGMRVGELCNLDLRDLNLPQTGISYIDNTAVRGVIEGRPDSLFVASDVSRGTVSNGEERTASNKRKRDTVVPIDDELRLVFVTWLAVRPDTQSDADPLFVSTSHWGRRVTPPMIREIVKSHAEPFGWYRQGASSDENVTPHYFRHFFTTHLRDRTGDRGIVKYLRGDVAQDIIDTYTHDWGGRVRSVYEANIYQLDVV